MRALAATALVLIAAVPAQAQPVNEALAAQDFPYKPVTTFKILRNGQEIGQHTLTFSQKGSQRTVTVAIDATVRLLGVEAYRFSHRGREDWNGGRLQALEARTEDGGRRFAVRARRSGSGLEVEREQPAQATAASMLQGLAAPETARETLPANTLPTSLWDPRQVRQSVLLNTRTGTLARVQVTPAGREKVPTASGQIEAARYAYSGDIKMDQWFDDRGRWVRSQLNAFDGSRIEYILQE